MKERRDFATKFADELGFIRALSMRKDEKDLTELFKEDWSKLTDEEIGKRIDEIYENTRDLEANLKVVLKDLKEEFPKLKWKDIEKHLKERQKKAKELLRKKIDEKKKTAKCPGKKEK